MGRTWWVCLLVVAALPAGAQPETTKRNPQSTFPPELARAFDEAVRAELEGHTFAGMSIGVMRGDRVWTSAYGYRDLARKRPSTPETTYRLASITKSFTAIAVMQLVEQGKLSLDQEIHGLVPEYPPKPWPITVRQLLAHLGGVPHYANQADGANKRRVTSVEATALFADKPLAAEPGTQFVYTTWGYNLLGRAVETASGLSYGDYLQKHVFGPAGMRTAALDDFRTRGRQHAVGYRRSGERLLRSRYLDVSSRFAGGGTRGSVLDLLAFGRAVLDDRLVSPTSRILMETTMRTRDGRLTDYGLGFATYPQHAHYVVAHAGGQPETTSLIVLLPADDLVIALAANLEGEIGLFRRITTRIIERVLEDGRVRRDAYAQNPADRALYEALYRTFTYGVAYQRWRAGHMERLDSLTVPLTVGDVRAFGRALKLLDRERIARDPKAAIAEAREGHQPHRGAPLLRAGVLMAQTLARWAGPKAMATYPAQGPLAFFADYHRACEALGCAPELRLPERLVADVARLRAQWEKSEVPALVRARLEDAPDPAALWAEIEARVLDAPFHPDYAEEMIRVAERLEAKGRKDQAQMWLERAVATHPEAPQPLLALADRAFAAGQTGKGLALYQKAFASDPGATVLSPAMLQLRGHQAKTREVRRLIMRAATTLYPEDPSLWRSLATAERLVGDRAAERQALETAGRLETKASPGP